MSRIVRLCFMSLLVFALSAVAFAQSTTTGSIGGVVSNPNKEVVTGATVTVKNIGTNKEDTFDNSFGTPSDLSNGFFFRERQIQLAVRFEF